MIFFLISQSFSYQINIDCSYNFGGEILIEQDVTEISNQYNALERCKNSITSLSFEEGSKIVKIGSRCFQETSLKSVDLSKCTELKELDSSVFYSCKLLKTVKLPPNIEKIGSHCFYYNENLASIDFPGSLVTLNESAFANSGLTTINFLPESKLKVIASSCFAGNHNLISIDIPDSVVTLEHGAFSGSGLTTIKFSPNSKLETIGNGCFANIINLKTIDLPDSVVTLSDFAFAGSGIKTINISPNSKLETIREVCFVQSNISSIFIPKSVNSMPSSAFYGCQFIENITVDKENTNYKSDSTSVYSGTDNSTLFRVFVSYSGEYIIPSYVTKISDSCFFYCVNITSIQTNNDITSIGERAFYNCKSLTNITIPPKINVIESEAFYNCQSLTKITIPPIINNIGSQAFYNCKSLTKITIPSKINNITLEFLD